MKKIVLFICIGSSLKGQASAIFCNEKNAGSQGQQKSLETKIGEKLLVFKSGENTTYLTERNPSFFSIEMFMGALDQRIYAEGPMPSNQSLKLAYWGREALIEIECRRELK